MTAPTPAAEAYDHLEDGQTTPDIDAVEYTGDAPDVDTLIAAITDCTTGLQDYHQRMLASHETRYCLWDGQASDGRKWRRNIGQEPFPWEGASDARVKLAEEIIVEMCAREKAAFARGSFQAVSKDVASMQQSQLATMLLNYVVRTQMQPELRDEISLAANWKNTYGLAIVHVGWQRETRMEPATITMEEIATQALTMAAQSPQGQQFQQAQDAQGLGAYAMASVEETIGALMDPEQEPALIRQFAQQAPWLSRAQAREVIRDLRESGTATYPTPRTAVNRPRWTALRPMVDVYFPRETRHIQRAPWIAMPVDLSLDQLRDMERTEGWDREFINEVESSQKGISVNDQIGSVSDDLRSTIATGAYRSYADTADDRRNMYQVLRVFYRASDRRGFPGVYEAVIHPALPSVIGKTTLIDHAHGLYPFVSFARERTVPSLVESRGVPEVVETDQMAVKVQRDYRTDRTELGALPPFEHSANRGGGRYPIKPGAQIPARPNSVARFMDLPKLDSTTMEIEQATRDDIARYFGRSMKEGDPATTLTIQQGQVDDFLIDLSECVKLTWADMQQRMEEVTIAKVLGPAAGSAPIRVSRADIQGSYDFSLRFDVGNLDMENLVKRMDAWSTFVLAADTLGVVDRASSVALAAQAIDPTGAPLVLRDPAEAQADETEDEKAQLAKISAGVEPAMIEGQNHGARAQTLQQAIQANPQLMQRYEQDEIFRALVDARLQHHQHQVQQQENAQIGRMGAGSVLGV